MSAPMWLSFVLLVGGAPAVAQLNGSFENRELIRTVHDGRFNFIEPRDDFRVKLLFVNYVLKYSDSCRSHILNPVELKKPVCSAWWENRRGVRTRCTDWASEGRGKFAEPRFASVVGSVEISADFERVQRAYERGGSTFIRDLLQDGPDDIAARSDVTEAIRVNGCASPALKLLSENLLRRVQDQMSVQAERGDPAALQTVAGAKAERWISECRAVLPSVAPNARPESCNCLQPKFRAALTEEEMNRMLQQFSVEEFLLETAAKVGFMDKVAACLK